MYLPPLQPLVNRSDNYLSGDVIVHPSAAIAPGVILQAAPNSRIEIGEGVCLGMGVIINAYQGTIAIENGAVLGSGVLVIGEVTIGEGSCIGATTTIFNASVKAREVIAAGSLIGDTSRQIDTELDGEEINGDSPKESNSQTPVADRKLEFKIASEAAENSETITAEEEIEESEIVVEEPSLSSSEKDSSDDNNQQDEAGEKSESAAIFGKLYVNQLLVTLFPQGQNFNSSPPEQK